jgi:hypothetical protein
MGIDGCASWVSLVDNNLNHAPLYSDSFTNAYWQPLGAYGTSGFIGRCRYPELYARGSTTTTLNKKRGVIMTDIDTYNEKGINGTLAVMRQGFGQITSEDNNDYIVYEKGGELYDARGKLAAQSEIPSGGGTDNTKLPLTGGEVTGDVTLKYPAKLIGSGNGQQAADWLKYDARGIGRADAILEYCRTPRSGREIIEFLGLEYRQWSRMKYIKPLLESGRLKLMLPKYESNRNQRYVNAEVEIAIPTDEAILAYCKIPRRKKEIREHFGLKVFQIKSHVDPLIADGRLRGIDSRNPQNNWQGCP